MSVVTSFRGGAGHAVKSQSFRMGALIQAEFARITATRGLLVLAVADVLLSGLGTVSVGVTLNKPTGIDVHTSEGVARAFSSGFTGGLVASIFAALMITSEFRHRTVSQAVIDSGARVRWVMAKILPAVAVGLSFTTAAQFVTLLVGLPFLAKAGVHPDIWHGSLLRMTIGTALLGIPAALWGMAVGLLVRSQVGTVVGLIVYSVIAEAAVLQFLPAIGKWLPGGAQAALVDDPTLPYHNTILGVFVYAVWIVAIGAIGTTRFLRTDISS